jgi:hypothetical protein
MVKEFLLLALPARCRRVDFTASLPGYSQTDKSFDLGSKIDGSQSQHDYRWYSQPGSPVQE